jgi:hypothetical protein
MTTNFTRTLAGVLVLAVGATLLTAVRANEPTRHREDGAGHDRERHDADGDDHRRGDRDEECSEADDRGRPRAVALRIDSDQIVSSFWPDGTLSVSFSLDNRGRKSAHHVSIQKIEAPGASYVGPTALPYSAGTIASGDGQQLYVEISGASLTSRTPYPFELHGSYELGHERSDDHHGTVCHFTARAVVAPQAPSNGGLPKSSTTTPVFTVTTAVYPGGPLFHSPGDQPNEEGEFLPPLGQPQNFFTVAPLQSVLNQTAAFSPNDQFPPAGAGPNSVVFLRNQNGGAYSALPPDPNAAGADPSGFVLISANNANGGNAAAVSYSKDFGNTFTTVPLTSGTGFKDPGNPSRTDFFPESDGGLCCDQVVHYIPGRNLVVWLLQYWSPNVTVGGLPQKGQNRLRIAWATPQAAAADFLHAWSWIDISPTTLGDTTVTDWMDYPDLAYSSGYLYISVDHGLWNAGLNAQGNVIGQQVYNNRRWFVRASLGDMANVRPSVGLIYYEPQKTGLVKAHFVQSAPDTMYYAAEPDTSTLSVFADPDSSPNIPNPHDIGITSRCASAATNPCDYSVIAPDKLNWNVAPHGVLGGAYVAPPLLCPPEGCTGPTRFLYFAFDGGRDTTSGRPYPYVRVEKIDADALNRVSELDIWNSNFAFATPALVARPGSSSGDVAFSLATGGGTSYADNAVGFLGDFVAYVTTSSNATQSDSAGNVRYGDYFSVRNAWGTVTQGGQGLGYSTLGYAVTQATAGSTCAVAGCNITLQYVLFGRDSELFPVYSPPPR